MDHNIISEVIIGFPAARVMFTSLCFVLLLSIPLSFGQTEDVLLPPTLSSGFGDRDFVAFQGNDSGSPFLQPSTAALVRRDCAAGQKACFCMFSLFRYSLCANMVSWLHS